MRIEVEALYGDATRAHKSGQFEKAADLYRRILTISRRYPDVLHLLGLAEHQMGNHRMGADFIREAIALNDGHAGYHNNLASALIALGESEGARTAAARAVTLKPNYAQAWSNLASANLRLGHVADAIEALRRSAALDQENAETHYWLARTLQDEQRFAEAAAAYGAALGARADFTEAHCNLCYVLHMMGRSGEAEEHCRKAIALRPGYTDALNNLGYVLQGQGDIDGAVAAYEETLRQDPTYAAAYNNLGNVYKDVGDFTRAAAAYRRALDYQPDFARAIFNLTDVKTFTDRNDPDFARLATQAVRLKDLPAAQARYIHFAMGKALDDIGAADESFAHVMAGNAVVRSLTNYDEAAALGQVEGAAARRVGGQGVASETPIFIVGMPRSGTTLVEQILASHPAVRGGGERRDFDHALQATGGHDARRLGEGYLARLPNLAPGQTRITDKLPANFLYAGLIHTALPQARIIHVMRDPADTCLSCFTKLFDTGQEFTYNLGELGRYYVAYARLMRHWRTVLPEHAFIEISYETLVADLEEQTRRLLSFCGLAWDPACLAFHTTQRVVQTASATQVRKPLYTSSIGRAAAFQNHLAPLLTELAKL